MFESGRGSQVALSFPGEQRPRVERIAETLATTLGRENILYDKWHRAEFARPNLDVYLPSLYHNQSLLIVFFLCGDYARKEWCGLEWRAGRDLLKHKEDHRLMLLRLDRSEIDGLYSIDGYLDIDQMSDDEVSSEIQKRLSSIASPPGANGSEQDHLFRLFQELGDRRLLTHFHGTWEYLKIVDSVERMRADITNALVRLGPVWPHREDLETVRHTLHDFQTLVERHMQRVGRRGEVPPSPLVDGVLKTRRIVREKLQALAKIYNLELDERLSHVLPVEIP